MHSLCIVQVTEPSRAGGACDAAPATAPGRAGSGRHPTIRGTAYRHPLSNGHPVRAVEMEHLDDGWPRAYDA